MEHMEHQGYKVLTRGPAGRRPERVFLRYRLISISVFLAAMFLSAVGIVEHARQQVRAEREPAARDGRFDAAIVDGARAMSFASFEATPEIRVEPSSLMLPTNRTVHSGAIAIAEIGAKQGIQDLVPKLSAIGTFR